MYAGKFGALLKFGDGLVWPEGIAQVVDMAIGDVFYTKIVDNEYKEDGSLFVTPKTRGGGGLVAPLCAEASFEELVGINDIMG